METGEMWLVVNNAIWIVVLWATQRTLRRIYLLRARTFLISERTRWAQLMHYHNEANKDAREAWDGLLQDSLRISREGWPEDWDFD